MNTSYLTELRKLSVTARSAIALLVCEKYFISKSVSNRDTVDFLNYLWDWPIVTDFDGWEESKPYLVSYGLGDNISDSMAKTLELVSVDESNFRKVVSGTVEILWINFWGAAEDDATHKSLEFVLQASGLEKLPVLTPFKFSIFSDGDGWGKPVSLQDRDFWRECAAFV